jgi:branched-chain amino acid transport system permease protein
MKSLAFYAVVLVALLLVPVFLGPYYASLAIPIMATTIALMGLNLLFGYGGMMSLGHAMYVAIGAYSSAILGTKLGICSFELQLLVAILVSGGVAFIAGSLCVRYSSIFFSILTLALGMILHSLLFKMYAWTGGESGMSVPRPSLLGMQFDSLNKTRFLIGPFYYYSAAMLALATLVMKVVIDSPFGLALRAARDNASKLQFLGTSVYRVRRGAYVLSAVYCALGGAVLAVSVGAADPELAYWTQSGNLVFMVILGGLSSFGGAIVGAVSFTLMQDWLMSHTEYWRFGLGVTLAVLVIVAPQGLLGLFSRAFGRIRSGGSP